MKALIYEQHGGPEVLQYRDVPDPEPSPRDVVIKVAATTINRLDVAQRNGWFTIPGFSLPHISGMDVAGTVTETGSGVTRVKPGDRVLVNPSMSEVPEGSKLAGMDDLYGILGVIGGSVAGGYAEKCLAPETHLYPVPDRHVVAPCRRFPHLLGDRVSRPVRYRPDSRPVRLMTDPCRRQRRVHCGHSMGQAGGGQGPCHRRQRGKMRDRL